MFLISGCSQKIGTQEEAEKTAERFARFWEGKDWGSMYDLFIPSLQEMRSKENFVYFMDVWEKESNIVARLDKVSIDSDNLAYAYYTVSSSIYDSKAPAIKMVFDESWKINAFSIAFIGECAEDSCDSRDICEIAQCEEYTKFRCFHFPIENCCKYDFQCPDDKPFCLDNRCMGYSCLDDSECSPPNKFCHNGNCVECRSSIEDCKNNYVCDSTEGKCVRCMSDRDCENECVVEEKCGDESYYCFRNFCHIR